MAAALPLGQGLDAVFRPRSIAVIGASQDATKIGGRPVQFLLKYGYAGRVFPVNRSAETVQGLTAYASVDALPEVPDLAVVAVPTGGVVAAVRDCAARGVGAAVILTAGFVDAGESGAAAQAELTAIARDSGMRILGPNCLGAVSVATGVTATFSVNIETAMPEPGAIGIVSQSGNLGSYTMRRLSDAGVGISTFLATGNECDLDVADGIAWMAADPATRVILCCLETCRDAGKLIAAMDLARDAGKPLVVLKIGTSETGVMAAASHTGALAGSDAVFDAVLRRAGAIRVHSMEALVDLAQAAAIVGPDRLPRGNRVAILAASGGFGVMLADAATAAGLAIPRLSEATQARILTAVPFASPLNPVDTTAQVSSRPELLVEMLSAVLEDGGCETTILFSSAGFHLERLSAIYIEALTEIRRRWPDKLLVLCCGGPPETLRKLNALGYVTIEGIDAMCRTVAGLARMGRPAPGCPVPQVEKAARPLPPSAFANENASKQALAEAGIGVLAERVARSRAAALAAAEEIGFPVVLKILSPDIGHKSEVGGVAVGIEDPSGLAAAYDMMMERVRAAAPSARLDGVLVAQMAPRGVELIVGTKTDPIFGPVVLVGLGGIFAEIAEDVAVQVAPVGDGEAESMLRALKAFPLLDGARGRPKADVAAAAAAVAAISRFAVRHADTVAEIDVNPLLVLPAGEGAVALDALIVPSARLKSEIAA
ncbi:acetate--CoA ligase family protein [Acuticoccus sediminis]|uniref:acetate--CoA ligase family protein n=1 Tax=Acuticoccus sediminis TaxID=2184697 RepID=UPI001FD17459|nr:acetate--CoA ligase family protein [Acuticoccus sediminis]